MNLEFNFVADRVIKGKIYPALAQHQGRPYTASWREFGQHWPYTTPLRLEEYCQAHGGKINIYELHSELPANTFYPVSLGFFDFEIDYFEIMGSAIRGRLADQTMRVLFYYHEGDNPQRIKSRLDSLVIQHGLPQNCYVFVSSNSCADGLENFVTFADFELWYYARNREVPLPAHTNPRTREFTVLSRLHKWWRATVMTDLQRNNILTNSYWSYCEAPIDQDYTKENPIEIDAISRLRWDLEKFIKDAPYTSDELTQDQRNDHGITVFKYHVDSYCNIVLESQFDVDQSGGAFITEKTFKPIKHGQLFFIAGGAGSLQQLRDLGYRVFDAVLDNSYDLEPNHTERWIKLCAAIKKAQAQGLDTLYKNAIQDIDHNQRLFAGSKFERLNTLHQKIHGSN
jgi:hypothetical protein